MRSCRVQKECGLVAENRGSRKNITTSTRTMNQTWQENFLRELVSASGHTGQKSTRRQ